MGKSALLLVLVALIAHSLGVPYGKTPRPFQTQEDQFYEQRANDGTNDAFYQNTEQKGYEYPEQQFVESEQGQISLSSGDHVAPGESASFEPASAYGAPQESGYNENAQSPNYLSNGYPDQNDLTLSCSGQNKICTVRQNCVNGYVSLDQEQISQLNDQSRQCNVNYEVCCLVKLRHAPPKVDNTGYPEQDIEPPYALAGSGVSVNQAEFEQSGGHAFQEGSIDLPGQVVEEIGPPNEQPDASVDSAVPAQLPSESPINSGDASDAVPSIAQLPQAGAAKVPEVPAEASGSSLSPTHLQLGCAAALLCVEERFCTLEGTISQEPVVINEKQLYRRVPLSDCRNPDNGVIGKCCRDLSYVDPWPAGNLPANYSGGFDEQGFPTFLNIAKTRPPTKKPLAPTKTVNFQPIKTAPPRPSINVIPHAPFIPRVPVVPQQVVPLAVEENLPAEIPLVPENSEVISSSIPIPIQVPLQPVQPLLNAPNLPRPFSKLNYDSASSVKSPVHVAPEYPKPVCGVKNSVPRPGGLREAETAFGEIPWQAMVLSTEYRKILCSGVIIAPNAVVTAGHCVDGLHPNQISIKAGEWKLGYELKHEEPLPFEIVNVAHIKINPSYSSGLPSNDTALLLLEHPITFNTHVNTLCLPENVDATTKGQCIVTGWGKNEIQLHAAGAIMRGIDVDVLSYDTCQERLASAKSQLNIDSSVICTKAHKQNNNMCQVEPGSPLACDRGNGVYELVGVYSQDTGCLPTNQIAVFAPLEMTWMQTSLTTLSPPKLVPKTEVPVLPIEPDYQPSAHHEIPDVRKSNYPSENNQYLPPV
ncbi:uncharacterized protein [Prorops nasuta]|uniref:uncharacterized protein isoform X2 n=1 Tax=Prorops nasuta TaxID=863751 RepID=UPI0034CFEDF8